MAHSRRILVLFMVLTGGVTCAICTPGQQSSMSRQEKVEKFLSVIRDRELQQKDPNSFRAAIQELGKLRAAEAVDDLVKLLTYRREWQRERPAGDYITEGSSWTNYTGAAFPATTALENIGDAAVPALMRVIEGRDEASLESKNARYTVRAIFTRRNRNADAFFRAEATHAVSPEAARRLLNAVQTADQDWKPE